MQAGTLIASGAELFIEHELVFGHGTEDAYWEAAWIVYHVVQQPFSQSIETLELLSSQVTQIQQLFQRRIDERIPVAYLIHEAYFAGLAFYVDERVLIPRSPIAELITQQFAPWLTVEPRRLLDIGTGSGCIAIACAYAFGQAMVDAVDISEDALVVASRNVQLHQLVDRVHLYASDLFAALPPRQYDVIVSNPPYVDAIDMAVLPPEFTHEPSLGLAAGSDGLCIVERILASASQFLTPQGLLIVEVGNSETALISQYPHVPFTWLTFANGGQGVFLLTQAQLQQYFG